MFKILILSLILTAHALPKHEAKTSLNTIDGTEGDKALPAAFTVKECNGYYYNFKCLKIEAISMLEQLSSQDELELVPGISVVKETRQDNKTNPKDVAAEIARSFPGKPEEKLDKYLMYRLGSYLDSHAIKLKMFGDDENSSGVEESRRRKNKGGGGMGNLISYALMMKGTLLSLGLSGLALLAGKALMTALISLVFSALMALKSLSSGGGKTTTYEILTKPVYSHSASHEEAYGGHAAYGRSYQGNRRR